MIDAIGLRTRNGHSLSLPVLDLIDRVRYSFFSDRFTYNVAISLCLVMCFLTIEKFNTRFSHARYEHRLEAIARPGGHYVTQNSVCPNNLTRSPK